MKAAVLLVVSLFFTFPKAQPPQHRVVIEVSVQGSIAYGIILNNAENLEKALAPQSLHLEIVCHGAGLDMLLPSSQKQTNRIKALQQVGAVFAACSNTMKGRHLTLKQLVSGAITVDSGVAEVVRKEESGWAYLKGG